MIEPAQLSLHQNISFLMKSDMTHRDVMQSLMRQVAREFAMADMVAASIPAAAPKTEPTNAQRSGIDGSLTTIESIVNAQQLNCPLVLKQALQKFGFDEAKFNSELQESFDKINNGEDDQSGSNQSSDNTAGDAASDAASDAEPNALDATDLAVFLAVDRLLPELQNLGQCTGLQLSFFRAPEQIHGMWKHRHIIMMLPIEGELGRLRAAFTFLLRPEFDPILVPGKLSMYAGNPLQPWPCQKLVQENQTDVIMQAGLRLERHDIVGKSFLMGTVSQMLPQTHWFEYDLRDVA